MAKKGFKSFLKGDSYSMSYLTAVLVNALAMSTTIGITGQLEVHSIEGFIVFVIFFTLIDTMIHLFIRLYFFKWVIQSLGLIYALLGFLVIFLTEQVVPDIHFNTIFGLIGFSVFFLVLRLMMNYTYERYKERKNERV